MKKKRTIIISATALIIIISVAVLVILSLSAVGAFNSPAESFPSDSSQITEITDNQETHGFYLDTIYDEYSKTSYLIWNGKLLSDKIDGLVNGRKFSSDRSVTILFVPNQFDTYNNLYCVYKGSLTLIGKGFTYQNTWISDDGSAFFTFQDSALYRYELPDGERILVHDSIARIRSIALSPDGNGLLYGVADDNYENVMLYYFRDGKNTKIGDNLLANAISDNEDIYYIDLELEALYYMPGPEGERTKIISGSYMSFETSNKSNTQFIYSAGDSYNDYEVFFIEKDNGASVVNLDKECTYIPAYGKGSYYHYGERAEDLRENFYRDADSNNVWYLDKDLETVQIVSDAAWFVIADNGNTLFYGEVRRNNIYKIQMNAGASPELVASDIYHFTITNDGETVYFTNRGHELFYIKGAEEAVKIADEASSLKVSRDGVLYYTADYDDETETSTLYACTTEKDIKRISNNVVYHDTIAEANYNYYVEKESNKKYNLYIGSFGNEFTLALKGYRFSMPYIVI